MSVSRRKDHLMSRTRITRAFVILSATTLGCLLGGCTENDPCDEGQILVDGWCNLASVDAAPPVPESDAAVTTPNGPETGGDEAGGGGGVSTAAFEKTCATNADCAAPAPYCAVQAGKCTATGCEVDPTVCPTAWPCMDLTPFGVALHLCVPPGTPGA
jgi:hypothetical protein